MFFWKGKLYMYKHNCFFSYSSASLPKSLQLIFCCTVGYHIYCVFMKNRVWVNLFRPMDFFLTWSYVINYSYMVMRNTFVVFAINIEQKDIRCYTSRSPAFQTYFSLFSLKENYPTSSWWSESIISLSITFSSLNKRILEIRRWFVLMSSWMGHWLHSQWKWSL